MKEEEKTLKDLKETGEASLRTFSSILKPKQLSASFLLYMEERCHKFFYS